MLLPMAAAQLSPERGWVKRLLTGLLPTEISYRTGPSTPKAVRNRNSRNLIFHSTSTCTTTMPPFPMRRWYTVLFKRSDSWVQILPFPLAGSLTSGQRPGFFVRMLLGKMGKEYLPCKMIAQIKKIKVTHMKCLVHRS